MTDWMTVRRRGREGAARPIGAQATDQKKQHRNRAQGFPAMLSARRRGAQLEAAPSGERLEVYLSEILLTGPNGTAL